MPGLGLPTDFAKKVRETLALTEEGVKALFEFEEDKKGFFVARLKPKQFLENPQFRAMCALVRDLGGQDYLQGAKTWKIPGPYAKGAVEKPSGHGIDSEAAYKESGNAEPSGVTPHAIAMDKSKPPQTSVPLKALLAMPFQCRMDPEDPGLLELTESIRTYGVLEPILVRPKPGGLYEIVAGQRRVKAAQKAGLDEIPVVIRFWSDEEAFVLQLTENLQRKDLSEEEKTRALGELARKTGWNAQQIADKLKMSYRWVCLYLPDELKNKEMTELGRKGGEASAGARLAPNRESQETVTPPTVPTIVTCARCGDPVDVPVHVSGTLYCDSCSQIIISEEQSSKKTQEPSKSEDKSFYGAEKETAEETEPVDFAEVTCSVCNVSFRLIHHGPHDHRIEYYGG